MASRREFFCLLFGSAAVVGVETMFGFSKWRGFQPELIKFNFSDTMPYTMDLRPGGLNFIKPGRTGAILKEINGVPLWIINDDQ